MKNSGLNDHINKFQLLYETGENDIADDIAETLGFSGSNGLIDYLKSILDAMGGGNGALAEDDTSLINEFTNILIDSTSSATISNSDEGLGKELLKIGKKVSKFNNDRDWFVPKHVFEDLGNAVSKYSDYLGSRTVLIQKGKVIVDKKGALEHTSEDHNPVEKQYLALIGKIVGYAKQYSGDEHSDIYPCLAKLYHKVLTLNPDYCNQQNAMEVAKLLKGFKVKEIENSYNVHDEGRYVVNFADMKFDKSILNTQDGLKLLEYAFKHYGKEAHDLLLDLDNEDISQILGAVSTQGHKAIMDMLMGRGDDNVVTRNLGGSSDTYSKPGTDFTESLDDLQNTLNSGVIYVKAANTVVSGLRFVNSPSAEKAWELGSDALRIYNLKCGFGTYSQIVKASEIGYQIHHGEYSKAFSAMSSTAFFLILPGVISAVNPVLGVIYTAGIFGSSLYSLRNDCMGLISEYKAVNAVQSVNRSDSNQDLKMRNTIALDEVQESTDHILSALKAEETILDQVEYGACRGVEISHF